MTNEQQAEAEARVALMWADGILTLLWYRYPSAIPDEIRSDFEEAMRKVLKVSRKVHP